MHEGAPGAQAESFIEAGGGVRQGWRTAIGSMICLIVGPSVIASLGFGVFNPYLREAFGWSVADVGWGVSIMAVMVTIVAPLSGILVDRIGARRLILICIPLFGAGFAAMSQFTGALWQFYLAWFLLPVLGVGLWPGSWVKATSGWFDHRLGLAIAIATLGVGLGAAIMPLVINHLAGTRGFRQAYAIIGIGSIVVSWPIAAAFVRDAPRRTTPAGAAMPFDYGAMVRDRAIWLLVAAFLCLGVFSSITLVNMVSVLEVNGMARQRAVIAFSVLGIATIAGRLLCGWLLDRASIRIVMPGFAIPAGLALLAIAQGVAGVPAYACAALLGMLVGAEIDVLGYAVKRFFGLARYGTIYGLVFACFHLGGAVGAFAMGAIQRTTGSFAPGMELGGLGCLLAAFVFIIMPRYRDPDRRAGAPGDTADAVAP